MTPRIVLAFDLINDINWWQLMLATVVVPAFIWIGKQIERVQNRKQQQSTSFHAELQRLKDDGQRLKDDNAALTTEGALQGERIKGYLDRIEGLSQQLAEAEEERDRAQQQAAELSRHKSTLKTIVLLLRNHVQDIRMLATSKGVELPPEPLLPAEPPD